GIRDIGVTGVQTCALPILSGPVLGGKSATRLSSHGLIPLWAAMILILNGSALKFNGTEKMLLFVATFLFSFHHIYTVIGPGNAIWFAILYSLSAIMIAFIF